MLRYSTQDHRFTVKKVNNFPVLHMIIFAMTILFAILRYDQDLHEYTVAV
jgi:hypothetical protein